MSSLAAQLAKNASLNADILTDRSRRKSAESYLFTGRAADQHDLESIHSLGVNGLLQLALLEPGLRKFEHQLFSEYAKALDRTLLSVEANAELDTGISALLALLGPYVMEAPTGKVLEWLVRRFRINEFNVEAVLSLFLPYHESVHFTKMISILHIKQNSTWSFLLPFKSAAQNLPRMSLVTEMLRNTEVSRFVTSLLPIALKENRSHRVLLAFNAACLHDFLTRSQELDEGTVAYLLPAFLEPLQQTYAVKDAILGSYVLLSALSQKCRIAPTALSAIITTMSSCVKHVLPRQFINAILSVCAPQEELEQFSQGTLDKIIRVPGFEKELQDACVWIGAEKILNPIVTGLVGCFDDETAPSLLESIISAPKVPQVVVQRSAILLIRHILAPEASSKTTSARRVLGNLQQRHPSVFQEAMDNISEEVDQDVVDQLRLSLAVAQGLDVHTNGTGSVDMVLASTNADARVRAVAVGHLLEKLLQKDTMSFTELNSVQLALLVRIQDTDQGVTDALYSQPQTLLPVLSANAQTYIDYLSNTLLSPGTKPKRSLLRAHFDFLLTQFCPANTSELDSAFQRIIFPFLLFSKGRQHTVEVVWDMIASQDVKGVHEWLSGCVSIIAGEKEKDVPDTIEKMANMNRSVASQIAQNISRSNNRSAYLDTLISKLSDLNPHVKAFGYIIVRALLGQLPGDDQVEAAHRILDVIRTEELGNMEEDLREGREIFTYHDEGVVAKAVVAKPNSKSTLQRLQVAVVTAMPTIPRPDNTVLNWLDDLSLNSPDNRGTRYIQLSRKIYGKANVSGAATFFNTKLLQPLFKNLGEDSLAFLAGIWIEPTSDDEQDGIQIVALHHASAFLQARILEDDNVDFQVILPSLLVALHSPSADQRKAAMMCMSHLHSLVYRPFTTIYGFDTIYGKNQNELQYLERGDSREYIDGLIQVEDHLIRDADYLKLFHQQHLTKIQADKKRDTEHKRRVLCYLSSHVNAITLSTAQLTLFKSIQGISNSAKAETLIPTIKSLASSAEYTYTKADQELLELITECFDLSVAAVLNDVQKPLWDAFVSLLRIAYASGSTLPARMNLSQALEHGLYSALSFERKVALCESLLDIGAKGAEAYMACKQLLSSLVDDVPLIVHVLDYLLPAQGSSTSHAAKRTKAAHAPEDALPHLNLFVEALGARSLPGSLDLISHLLETLSRVLRSLSSSQIDLSYIEQMLMSAIESAASKVIETPNLSPSIIRLDILVDVIRVADNPQTFHQALLLMANIARLVPDSVLHHVMPIFTFMGSNIFHRDDAYSFKVVQQTIDSIVPVMASSLKNMYSQPLELYIGAKGFLKVFTDAAHHIPRHRRTNFFAHLVDVLGPADFLPPICMLLVEKVTNRVTRQSIEEIQSSFSLPISVLQHCEPSLQISALTIILQESKRLVDRSSHPDTPLSTFLDVSVDEELATSMSIVFRRRAQALILFVGCAVKPSTFSSGASEEGLSGLIASLIVLITLRLETSGNEKVEGISQAAHNCLNKTLSVMMASDFINGVLSMLHSGDKSVQVGALDLVSERLPQVSSNMRLLVVPTVVQIIKFVQSLLSSQADESLAVASFKALRSIGLTLCPGEETPFTEVVPFILAFIKKRIATATAISTLSPIPNKIGPRVIPYFREIVSQCVAIIREDIFSNTDTFAVIHNLLSSIPTFWGAEEITQVVVLYTDNCVSTSNAPLPDMMNLIKTMAKRVPTTVLLPTLLDLWQHFKVAPRKERLLAYFDLLSRSLRTAARFNVLEHLRPTFKVFLESFELSKDPNLEVEAQVISAFRQLVVNLNEATFRPLFRRLYDWAFASDDNTGKVIFCHIYLALLDFFKGLMTPYMSFLLKPFVEFLGTFASGTLENQHLWAGVIETLTKSLSHDDGVFWRDDKLRQIASPLVQQVPVHNLLNATEGSSSLQDCLVALVDNVTDDMLLKSINLDVLMYTRAEDARLRLSALMCAERLWKAHGGKLLGFAAETTTFIAECTEDENDMVVRESFRLKDAVESVAGNVNGL